MTSDTDALLRELKAFEGVTVGPPARAADPVNQPVIRHWVEAIGDRNPVYVDEQVAVENGFAGVVAPPTMLQAWVMRGYRASAEAEASRAVRVTSVGSSEENSGGVGENGGARGVDASAQDRLFSLLDSAGFTSVVATNCEQHYARPLVLGDHLTANSVIESVSLQKQTALGDGHFVTTRTDFTDESGETVGTMKFRILRFRPRSASSPDGAGAQKSAVGASASGRDRPRRPRPPITQDNSFFFEGARQGKLLIQRCSGCGVLRHPPRPVCGGCGSFEWDTVESSGRGSVYSFVVVHHPQVPAFDYPLPIALVELEEGTRLVADLVDVDPADVEIGMPLECEFVAVDEDLTLPMFHPAKGTA